MNISRTVEIPEIGSVKFEHSTRARNLSITVSSSNSVRIAVPRTLTFRQAEKMIRHRYNWIRKQQLKIDSMIKLQGDVPVTAAPHLRERAKSLAVTHGFNINRVAIKNQKTRWGSCSSKNNINLNIQLYNLPPQLQDYVILHELVHTEHRNHSPRFWKRLEEFIPGARELNRQLKHYQLPADNKTT